MVHRKLFIGRGDECTDSCLVSPIRSSQVLYIEQTDSVLVVLLGLCYMYVREDYNVSLPAINNHMC